jgi:hypothetical protein
MGIVDCFLLREKGENEMTHSEACQLTYELRQQNGAWIWNGKGFDWNAAPECNYEVVQLGTVYSVQLKRA